MHYTATFRTHPPPQAAGTLYCTLDVDDLPAAEGSRPDRLTEVRPHERVQRHTMERIILAPILDVPVPLMEEQLLVDVFAPHDIQVPEQVIEVPKILIDVVSVRTPVREPQLAEQLVEVPTMISFSSLQRIVEQNVDIPVPRGECLQGFLPGHGSTSSSSSSHVPAGAVDELFRGFFRTFHRPKKSARLGPHSGSELSADSISSTAAAYEELHFSEDGSFYHEDDKKTWMRLISGWWNLLCSEPGEYRVDPRVDMS